MSPKFCGWLLRKLGWTTDGGPCPDKKAIILGVPHTSVWDFVISYLFYTQFGKTAHVMVKKEFFFWPVGAFLRGCGCVPVDRTNAASLVKSLIEHMDKDEEFVLAIAPEGTREPVRKWKTGYHLIATQTGVPVYLGYFDWGRKHVSIGKPFTLTGNAREDTDRIQAEYEKMKLRGRHPEKYTTGFESAGGQ